MLRYAQKTRLLVSHNLLFPDKYKLSLPIVRQTKGVQVQGRERGRGHQVDQRTERVARLLPHEHEDLSGFCMHGQMNLHVVAIRSDV